MNFLDSVSKNTHVKFHENTSSGVRVVAFRQTDIHTDRHDEANSRFFEVLRTLIRMICLNFIAQVR